MTQTTDLLDHLAEIVPGSPLAEARAVREAATKHAQGSYEVLFTAEDRDFPLSWRLALAQQIAAWHQDERLSAHYASRAGEQPDSEKYHLAVAHAETLTFTPAASGPQHLQKLQKAGWREDTVVTLSQLIAFVSFQSRLLTGLRLLNNQQISSSARPAIAAVWHTTPETVSGRKAPVAFTQQALGWEPWIAAKPLAEFNAVEQATLAKFGHSDSDYFRLLGRNLPLLEQRTLTDKGIFYTANGLPRAERELAAAVASKVNGCIFCASVHARKASQLSKKSDAVQQLIDTPPGKPLQGNQTPRWQAVIAFAAALSSTPHSLGAEQLAPLREAGLDELALLDLVQSAAFFAWANRLMLTLGEPFVP
ncbi:alkylhydroperoxidase domain protein [Erwinia amylovora]